MRKKIKVGIIGFGNVGSSLAAALADTTRYEVIVYDNARDKLRSSRKILIANNAREVITAVEMLIVAVKPQDLEAFVVQNKECLLSVKPLLVSVAAGVRLSWFRRKLKGLTTIRVMPNLALKVRKSLSFIAKGDSATQSDSEKVKEVFSSIGEVAAIGEKYLDKVTAISGSGPGYVFYFMESMYQGALSLGFTRKEAKKIVIEVFSGAVKLAKSSGEEFKSLIKGVASKKGTTEAALHVFKAGKMDKLIVKAINSAYQRAGKISSKLAGKRK